MSASSRIIAALCCLAAAPLMAQPASFALMGDLPYNSLEISVMRNMIAETGRDDSIAFVVHDGDIKSGGEPCTDELFLARKADFEASRHPLILIPGDNEWTDCHRVSNGGYDPLERLARLRELFFSTGESMGERRLKLERQSDAMPAHAIFKENVRWTFANTLIVGLNIPGSNNNWLRPNERGGDNREFNTRLAANTAWIADAFRLARERNHLAVMLILQANPDFEGEEMRRNGQRANFRDGFAEFKAQLVKEARAFGKPVMVVHGDTHRYQINQPVKDEAGNLVTNITRLETFGSPFNGWVKVTVDANSPTVFRTEPKPYGQ